MMAFISLPLGALIVLTHNHWVWSPKVFVTIVGWAALLKATLFLLIPNTMLKIVPKRETISKFIAFEGLLLVLLCGWILYLSFFCPCAK